MKREEFADRLHENKAPVSAGLRQRTLLAAQGKGERLYMKRKISVALAAALVAVLLCAVALAAANRWGILDFVGEYSGVYIPEDAQSYVKTDVAALQNEWVTANVRELYYDGRISRMTVDVTPKEEKTLLLGEDVSLEDPFINLTHEYVMDGENDMRTVYEVIEDEGYEHAYVVCVYLKGAENGVTDGSMDYILGDDGTLTIYMQEEYTQDLAQRDVTVSVMAMPVDEPITPESQRNYEKRKTMEQAFTLTAAVNATSESASKGTLADTYVNVEPIDYASIGVRVERVLIQVKPQEIYAMVDFTVIDPEAYAATDDGLFFEFIDPDKPGDSWEQRLTAGLSGGGGVYPIDETHYQQRGTLGRNELHESYTLRAYECWERERFETFEVKMRPATQEDVAAMLRIGEETAGE